MMRTLWRAGKYLLDVELSTEIELRAATSYGNQQDSLPQKHIE